MRQPDTQKTAAWRSFTEEEYRDVISQLVHFSTKTINTNSKPAGIRLAPDATRPMRYLCASAVLAAGTRLPLDYLTNSGPAATIGKQLGQVLNGNLPDDAPSDDVTLIRRLYDEASTSALEIGNPKVSPRLRQLLLPCEDGSYVAITPVTSSGLTAAVRQRTRENHQTWRDTIDKQNSPIRRLRTAYMGLGGANPVNIGRLANNWLLQYPLFFSAPKHDADMARKSFAAHQGVQPLLSKTIMMAMRDRLLALQQRHHGELPTDLKTRNTVDQFMDRLTHSLLQRATQVREGLVTPMETTPEPSTQPVPTLHSLAPHHRWPHLSAIQQGLLEPTLRDKAWREALTAEMLLAIDQYAYPGNVGISFNKAWLTRMERRIEENLL